VNKRCAFAECRKHPKFGRVGGRASSATHCADHKPDGYEDVVNKRCKTCPLAPAKFVHPRSKTKQCFECDSSLWRRQRFKEEAFANALISDGFTEGDIGPSLSFNRELPVDFTCCELGVDRTACGRDRSQRARVDFVFQGQSSVVLVELDEDQHTDRCMQAEVARASEMVHALWVGGNTRYTLVVRFNPDTFRVDGKTRYVPLSVRYTRVINVIRSALNAVDLPAETFAVQYMYYDVRDGHECIRTDMDPNIASLCLPPIT
jgi:hypothetical protein